MRGEVVFNELCFRMKQVTFVSHGTAMVIWEAFFFIRERVDFVWCDGYILIEFIEPPLRKHHILARIRQVVYMLSKLKFGGYKPLIIGISMDI